MTQGVRTPLFFAITCCCFFLQSLFKVKLIINNTPLTYIYPNNIERCLTLNLLLFSRQLLSSSITASTVVWNLTALSSTTDQINRISNHFLDRWRHEYVLNLRETKRTSKLDINSLKVNVNDTVLVIYEKVLRHFWRIGIVMRVVPSRDSENNL